MTAHSRRVMYIVIIYIYVIYRPRGPDREILARGHSAGFDDSFKIFLLCMQYRHVLHI